MRGGPKSFWQKILCPEALFTVSFAQVSFIYSLWLLGIQDDAYQHLPSQLGFTIWAIGYLGFLSGCRVSQAFRLFESPPAISLRTVNISRAQKIAIFLFIVQGILLINLYGGIPLLNYLSGSRVVEDAHDKQLNAAFGQLGLFVASTTCCAFFVVTAALKDASRSAIRGASRTFFIIIVVGLTMIAGKRQGAFQVAAGIISAAVFQFRSPFEALGLFVTGIQSRLRGIIVLVLSILALFATMESLEAIRTGGQVGRSRGASILAYMEIPLINFDYQTQVAGFGPAKGVDPRGVFMTLLPRRLWDDWIDPTNLPAVLEPTSPSGFWQYIHWYLGTPAVAGAGFVIGMLCRWCYNQAFASPVWLAIYCLIPWCLVTAVAYNHFLNLAFFLLPSILTILIILVAGNNKTQAASQYSEGVLHGTEHRKKTLFL